MPDLFVATDPRGCTITCSRDVWQKKIIVKHTIMRGLEAEVRQAIEQPIHGIIFQDAINPNRCIYYALRENGRQYVKVVAQMEGDSAGKVITAFVALSLKRGETILWPPSKT